MLKTLRVKNLAIVENACVEFASALNVITGETGAGKSILVGALGLILGERFDKSAIRSGEDQCVVEAAFHLPASSEAHGLLKEHGLEPCEDGILVLRRVASASGSGKHFINDSPATLQALKKVGDLLVDMHGPHDHQSLLNPDFQLDTLDAFARLSDRRAEYRRVYDEMRGLESEREGLAGNDQERAQQRDMLAFQVNEIEQAKIAGGEYEELERERALIANAQRIIELTGAACSALTDGEGSAFDAAVTAQRNLAELAGLVREAEDWRKEAESVVVQIRELAKSAADYAARVQGDPGRLQWVEDRVALYQKLRRKYGATTGDMLNLLNDAKKRMLDLENREERLSKIDAELATLRERLGQVGGKLGEERRSAASRLAKAITAELRDLGFERGAFDVRVADTPPQPTGMNAIEFGFAPNVGEPMRPLRLIASSGEISRVMLAIKAVLAGHDRIPVLVFDEIDVNVGGEMGNAVGTKLARVARLHQVLCVTHLPQVAVHGNAHFVVNKTVKGGRTFTGIEQVSDENRVREIARMIRGAELTDVTLRHAREMLSHARA